MLKSIQEVEDAEKLMQLIPKMRRGECDVLETWFIQECLKYRRGLTKEVTQLLHELPEEGTSAHEAWVRGLMARLGVGEERDERRAAKILKPHEQDPLCAALLGYVYLRGHFVRNVPRGAELLERSAAAGCAQGICWLGRAYEIGEGVAEDEWWAYELVHRAADISHPGAMDMLGVYLEEGTGVEQDEQLAVRYYENACSYRDMEAMYNLADCYEQGTGVEVDGRRAASLYRKAIVLGDQDAQDDLDQLPAESAVPWGEWCSDPLMHKYVPPKMKAQMRTVLLMRARPGTLFAQLPKDIIIKRILYWICTEPYEEPIAFLL